MMDRSTIRVALRTLARHKGFTTVAILSLAVAIALNTVMYSVTVAVVAPKVNITSPDQIYTFNLYGTTRRLVSMDQIESALRAGAKDLVDVTGRSYTYRSPANMPLVESTDRYKRIDLPAVVLPNYFDFLGTPAMEGRTFRSSDATEGGMPTVISHRLAQHLFPDESPVGRTVLLDGNGYTVIGVVEYLPGFPLLTTDMYLLRPPGAPPTRISLLRFNHKLEPFTLGEQLKLAAARLALSVGQPTDQTTFVGKPVHSGGRAMNRIGGLQYALIFAVLAVLLVACANLANLQLARGLARNRELALRAAVGASRSQLIQLLLLESGILAAAGLALGIVLTVWGVYIVRATIPEVIADFFIAPRVSWTMFVFAAIAALVCLMLVGLVPALRISRVDPNEMLKAGAGTGANRHHRRRYGVMVVAQIAFALPLLVGCVLLLRGSYKLHSREYMARYRYGFDPQPLVVGRVPILRDAVRRAPQLMVVGEELINRARSIPGITEAGVYISGRVQAATVTVERANGTQEEKAAYAWSYRVVSPSYFRTMGRAIAQGRGFTESESDGRAVVIDSRTAKYLYGDADPIGRLIKFGPRDSAGSWHEIVGIVGDRRSWETIERLDQYAGFRMSEVFRSAAAADTVNMGPRTGAVSFYARTDGNTELAAIRMTRTMRAVRGAENPSVEPMELDMGISLQRQATDFVAALFSTFGLIGLALVAIGVYGIVAHSVEERRREIAVRISMGATMRDILHAVMREGNVLLLSGVAVGLIFAKYSVWQLSGFIDEPDGYHALLYAYIAAGLFASAVFAAFIPALRATRIDPVEALRHE